MTRTGPALAVATVGPTRDPDAVDDCAAAARVGHVLLGQLLLTLADRLELLHLILVRTERETFQAGDRRGRTYDV